MVAPTLLSRSSSQVSVQWSALIAPNNGGSSITSYNLYWDQGTSTWASLVGESSGYTGTTYSVGVGIT